MLTQAQATTENGSEDTDRQAASSRRIDLPVSASDEASDSGRGLLLFLTFVTAILVMVLAVWLAAAVGQWRILIPVVAVDLIATTAVMGVVIWMLGDGANPAQPDIRALPPIPAETNLPIPLNPPPHLLDNRNVAFAGAAAPRSAA